MAKCEAKTIMSADLRSWLYFGKFIVECLHLKTVFSGVNITFSLSIKSIAKVCYSYSLHMVVEILRYENYKEF